MVIHMQPMYGDMHAAIDTKHCIHIEMWIRQTNSYTISHIQYMYSNVHTTIDTQHLYEWRHGYNSYASRNTISHVQQYIYNIILPNITHIALHMRHAPNMAFYGNRFATLHIQPVHVQPHICNVAYQAMHKLGIQHYIRC